MASLNKKSENKIDYRYFNRSIEEYFEDLDELLDSSEDGDEVEVLQVLSTKNLTAGRPTLE